MKKLSITFCFLVCTHFIFSQTVVSSCSASDSIKSLYMTDANRLALKKIFAKNLTYKDSIVIPQTHVDTVLNALIAVYNATTLPARNTVISQYNIHTFPTPSVKKLDVAADSNLAWVQQLKLGNIPTGNTQVDNLISKYHLTINNYNTYYGLFPYHIITFTSDSCYNIQPLSDLFETIPSVSFSDPATVVGDGHDISATIYPSYVELAYSLGWGDCPSGCTARHYWKFNVYYDCSVQFAGESGTSMPIAPVPTIVVSGIYCANEILTVTISSANSGSLNNQPLSALQFTLSSPTPTSYIISASNLVYPAFSTSSISISIVNCNTLTTSINENKLNSNISIYPNPANEHLELIVNNYELFRDFNSLSIYNGMGQLIGNEKISFKDKSITINTSELVEGVYFIIISNSNNERLTEKLLISR